MASSRQLKKIIQEYLQEENWQSHLDEILEMGQKAIPALFSLLLREPLMRHRSARALGLIIAAIASKDMEAGRNFIRQFMWRMNEDSGNIGWGIPEAFAETLAASPELAREYGHILLSYIIDLGFADNYCDYAPLRRSCYWAAGRFAEAYQNEALKKRKWLVKGLEDEDEICRGMAAWALGKLEADADEVPALQKLLQSNPRDRCHIFEDGRIMDKSVAEIAQETISHDLHGETGNSQARLF